MTNSHNKKYFFNVASIFLMTYVKNIFDIG